MARSGHGQWARWKVRTLVVALVVTGALEPGRAARAQTAGLGLAVTPSQILYYPGETLSLSLSADNPGLPTAADFYAGVILPDGATVVTFALDGTPSFGTLGNLASLRPTATGVSLAAPFTVALAPFLERLWTGAEPLGLYTLFLAAVRAGGLGDGRLDAGELLGLRTAGMRLLAPAQATLETGQAASTVMSSQGGTLVATGSGGLTYALTVPPGALAQPATITLTPVAAVTGLPVAGTLVAAVRAEPEGLAFLRPATLTIGAPGLGGTPGPLVGFTARGNGTGFQLLPALVTGDAFTLTLTHFSTTGGLQPDSGTLVPGSGTPDPNAPFLEELALLLAPRPDLQSPAFRAAALDIFVRWFTQVIHPQLTTAVTDATFIERAVQDYIAFHQAYSGLLLTEDCDILTVCGFPGGDVDVRPLVSEGFRNALAQANQRCLADKANFLDHIAAVINVSKVMSALTDENDPRYVEFSLQQVAATLCVRARVRGVLFPGTIPPGEPTTLEVQVDVAFTDGVLVPAPDNLVGVEVTAVGATLGTGSQLVVSPGAFITPVTPNPGSLAVTLEIATFWNTVGLPGETRTLSVCVESPAGSLPARAAPRAAGPLAQEGQCAGLAVTPASVTVALGATVQFTASLVAGQPFTNVSWSVTGGGTISPTGLFTAGTTPGTFTVRATSLDDPALFGEAQVTVTSAALVVLQGHTSAGVSLFAVACSSCTPQSLVDSDVQDDPNPGAGSVTVQVPSTDLVATEAMGSSTAQGAASATRSITFGAGGSVTLSGSGSVSSSASRTGDGRAAVGSTAEVQFNFEITTSYAYTLTFQLTPTGDGVSAQLQGVGGNFEGTSDSVSGILSPGERSVFADGRAGADTNPLAGPPSSSASFSFTLTLTPQ